MSKKDKENVYTLMAELQNYSQQGISIWLEGRSGNCPPIINAGAVREDISYMRDYPACDSEPDKLRCNRSITPD